MTDWMNEWDWGKLFYLLFENVIIILIIAKYIKGAYFMSGSVPRVLCIWTQVALITALRDRLYFCFCVSWEETEVQRGWVTWHVGVESGVKVSRSYRVQTPDCSELLLLRLSKDISSALFNPVFPILYDQDIPVSMSRTKHGKHWSRKFLWFLTSQIVVIGGTSLVIQGLRLCAPNARSQVRSLIRELRFCRPCGMGWGWGEKQKKMLK